LTFNGKWEGSAAILTHLYTSQQNISQVWLYKKFAIYLINLELLKVAFLVDKITGKMVQDDKV
jgi:hypothetical protein